MEEMDPGLLPAGNCWPTSKPWKLYYKMGMRPQWLVQTVSPHRSPLVSHSPHPNVIHQSTLRRPSLATQGQPYTLKHTLLSLCHSFCPNVFSCSACLLSSFI